jgi:hypothetical protein
VNDFELGQVEFREATLMTAKAAQAQAEITAAFLASNEVRSLRAAFRGNVSLELRIFNSNKYTRIEIPDCPQLLAEITCILLLHGLKLGNPYAFGYTVQLVIPRTRMIDETIEWVPT